MVRVRPDRTEQAVATTFLLQKQLYVYERLVWRLFLKKEVNQDYCIYFEILFISYLK